MPGMPLSAASPHGLYREPDRVLFRIVRDRECLLLPNGDFWRSAYTRPISSSTQVKARRDVRGDVVGLCELVV